MHTQTAVAFDAQELLSHLQTKAQTRLIVRGYSPTWQFTLGRDFAPAYSCEDAFAEIELESKMVRR